MKISWWISILMLLTITGCQSIRPDRLKRISHGHTPEVIDYHIDSSALFKCTMEIGKHRLSGLMFIKNIDTAESRSRIPGKYRIVFANEIGLTFLDFELSADSIRLLTSLEALRKKSLLNLLKMDYQLITGISGRTGQKSFRQAVSGDFVKMGYQHGITYWKQYNPQGDTLRVVSSRRSLIDKVFIRYDLTHGSDRARISIHHPVIGLKITLRRLK